MDERWCMSAEHLTFFHDQILSRSRTEFAFFFHNKTIFCMSILNKKYTILCENTLTYPKKEICSEILSTNSCKPYTQLWFCLSVCVSVSAFNYVSLLFCTCKSSVGTSWGKAKLQTNRTISVLGQETHTSQVSGKHLWLLSTFELISATWAIWTLAKGFVYFSTTKALYALSLT